MNGISLKSISAMLIASFLGVNIVFAQSDSINSIWIDNVIQKDDKHFARIDKGSQDGIYVGQQFDVKRQYKGGKAYLFTASIIGVNGHKAAIQISNLKDAFILEDIENEDRLIFERSKQLASNNGGWTSYLEYYDDGNTYHIPKTRSKVFGLKAGVSVAHLHQAAGLNTHLFNSNRSFGFSGGVFATLRLSDIFRFQPEILYTMKGARLGGNLSTVRIHYLEVPLLLKVSTSARDRFHIFGGLNGAVRLKTEGSVAIGLLKRYDLGFVVGMGLDMSVFTIDSRFTFGVTSVSNSANGNFDRKNSALLVLVGYYF